MRDDIKSVVAYADQHPELKRLPCFIFLFSARRWKYNNDIYQYWVEFEESGELTKLYLQRQDHVETKDAQNSRELQKLTAGTPFKFDGISAANPVQPPALGNEKPKAELEVKARSFTCLRMPLYMQDAVLELPKAMEGLLAKSAKLRDIEESVRGEVEKSQLVCELSEAARAF